MADFRISQVASILLGQVTNTGLKLSKGRG